MEFAAMVGVSGIVVVPIPRNNLRLRLLTENMQLYEQVSLCSRTISAAGLTLYAT